MTPAKSAPRLKPCPFCGAVPRKARALNITYDSGHYAGCWLGEKLQALSERVIWPDEFDKWNTRRATPRKTARNVGQGRER